MSIKYVNKSGLAYAISKLKTLLTLATSSKDGLMSSSDKSKLDSINNPVVNIIIQGDIMTISYLDGTTVRYKLSEPVIVSSIIWNGASNVEFNQNTTLIWNP